MKPLKLIHYEILNDFILFKWSENKEGILSLQSLRDNCPCASCSGETDVFGNIYKGPEQKKTVESYKVIDIKQVGHYAIQPYWKDGHHDGIFSYDFLKKLCEAFEES